jgi:hypothetical protein
MNRENILLQIEMTKAYIALWQTRILSGECKQRNMYHYVNGAETRMTDDELVKEAVDTMTRHVNRLGELTQMAMV